MWPEQLEIFDKVKLYKVLLLVACLPAGILKSSAQDLEFLPPVIADRSNKDTATSFVIATIDQAKYDHKFEAKPYVNGIEIVDADQPWPPRWYAARPVYTAESFAEDVKKTTQRIDFMESPTFVDGYLLFIQVKPITALDGKHPFDTQHGNAIKVMDPHMQVIDSVKSPLFYGNKYTPGYRSNPKIELLTILRTDSMFDLRGISGNQQDSAVDGLFGVMQVFDNRDSLKMVWNPMQHLDLRLFHLKEKLEGRTPTGPGSDMRFTKICNVNWDHDGNMLYTVLNTSMGKVSRKDGHIIWHFDTEDMPLYPDNVTLQSYAPSDFQFLYQKDSFTGYTFFERGLPGRSLARGVIFEVNNKTQKARLVKYVYPHRQYRPTGQGGFDYDINSGNYLIDYGIFDEADTTAYGFWTAFEYGRKDSISAAYRIPEWNYAFGVHRLDSWPRPARPSIKKQGNHLVAMGGDKEYTWYKLSGVENTIVTKIGEGVEITPEKGGTYCVVTPTGIGYSVSRAFVFKP